MLSLFILYKVHSRYVAIKGHGCEDDEQHKNPQDNEKKQVKILYEYYYGI